MMASNLLSRLLPPSVGSPSIYEALRKHDESADSDVEDRAGTSVDEENLRGGFQDYELDHAGRGDISESQMTNESTASLLRRDLEQATGQEDAELTNPRWMASSNVLQDALAEADDGDDEVPASLLVEGNDIPLPARPSDGQQQVQKLPKSQATPATSTRDERARWTTAQGQQPLYLDDRPAERDIRPPPRSNVPFGMISRQDRAEWRWANVQNLDNFLKEVYEYFLLNGFRSILLSRLLNLLTLAFVVGFTIILSMCVDYGKIPQSKSMSQVLVPQCTKNMSSSINIFLWLFTFFWIGKAFQHLVDIRRLRQIHDFYLYLLNVPDSELQTLSWQEIVARLMALRDKNPITADGISPEHRRFVLGTQSKQRMDAQDIANRLMRKENYLIALFNKEILDLTLPVPFLRNRQLFSKALEWNLSFCILDYVFNEDGQVKALFTKSTHRRMLSDGLRDRFKFAGFMNIICAPFIVAYCVIHYFFRYFNEYQHNPSQLGSRQYTPLAEWKFREFNELWHLFQRRINMSYPFASRYVDQFPKDKTIQVSRFVAFVAGALTSVLALASVIDPELFLGFEITPERTVLFYLGVFGTIWAVARGAVPEETLVFDPEYALREVIEYTHYLPNEWRGRLHSDRVKREFSTLYQMKIVTFLEEIFCLILTPFILWFALPKCSDRIVDFFREFTIEVDGLGRICSFAEFDFKKAGDNIAQQRPQQDDPGKGLREDYYATKDGKMLASYFGFLDNYSNNPRPNAPYTYPNNKRIFQHSPGYNVPVSPEISADHGLGRQARPARPSPVQRGIGRSQGVSASMRRGSRILPGAVQASPMPSMLLDPHHQPSASGFRSGSRLVTQSRYRAGGPSILDETIQDEDELDDARLADAEAPNSTGDGGLNVEDSLGDSWRTTRGAARDEGDREDEHRRRTEDGENGAGVLGLLYQFQKAQTAPRAGGVNI